MVSSDLLAREKGFPNIWEGHQKAIYEQSVKIDEQRSTIVRQGNELATMTARIEELEAENKRLLRIANYVGGSPSPIPWDQLQQKYLDEIDSLKQTLSESIEREGQIDKQLSEAREKMADAAKAAAEAYYRERILQALEPA